MRENNYSKHDLVIQSIQGGLVLQRQWRDGEKGVNVLRNKGRKKETQNERREKERMNRRHEGRKEGRKKGIQLLLLSDKNTSK